MQLANENERRLRPRIWDTDWLVLRDLSRLLKEQVLAHVKPKMKIVDFGCGSMPYRTMIEGCDAQYIGADFDDSGDIKITADGLLPLPDKSVNAALSVQVLEHVRDLDVYCAEMHRVLTDDGFLLLSTHGTWLYHPHPEDHRRWTRTGLIEDLKQRGFTVDDLHAITGPLATTTIIRLTGFVFVLCKIPIIGRFLSNILSVIMNLRAVIEDFLTPKQIKYDNSCIYLLRARKYIIS